jgi:hypothetical protein
VKPKYINAMHVEVLGVQMRLLMLYKRYVYVVVGLMAGANFDDCLKLIMKALNKDHACERLQYYHLRWP